MSNAARDDDASVQRIVQIPSLLTNSLRAVLATFGTDIIQLRATGSVETTNGTHLDSLRDYGVSWEQQDTQRLTIDYEQLPGADGPANPLNEQARTALYEELDARLAHPHHDVSPDLAVSSFTIRVTDDRLEVVTPGQSPTFDLRFVSDPVKEPLREVTKLRNDDRGLYRELGFEVRNLNLRSVIETATKFHEQADGKYLSWAGPADIRPRSPERLAIRINDSILPDAYGLLKPYVVTDDRVLELADSAAEGVDPYDATATSHESTGGDI